MDRFERFRSSRQEKQRLLLALEGYFAPEESGKSEREAYEKYLRMRIRPAMAELMRAEDTKAIRLLWERGFFDARALERFITEAREGAYLASMICLLRIRQKETGFGGEAWKL